LGLYALNIADPEDDDSLINNADTEDESFGKHHIGVGGTYYYYLYYKM